MLLSHDITLSASGDGKYVPLYVLVTRYNLPMRGELSRAEKQRWLDSRLRLFRDFCLTSVLAQTKKPDLWILGLDVDERDLVEPVLDTIKGHPWMVPAWVGQTGSSKKGWSSAIRGEIRARFHDAVSHVALTRLDSDDALGRTYMQQVAEYSRMVARNRPELNEFWIAFPLGVDYFNRRCYLHIYPGNAFQTVVLRRSEVRKRERFFVDHSTLLSGDYTVFLPATPVPMWLRNIHEGTILNARGREARLALVPTRRALRGFGLDPETLEKLQPSGWRAYRDRVLTPARARLRSIRRALRR